MSSPREVPGGSRGGSTKSRALRGVRRALRSVGEKRRCKSEPIQHAASSTSMVQADPGRSPASSEVGGIHDGPVPEHFLLETSTAPIRVIILNPNIQAPCPKGPSPGAPDP